MLEKGVKKRIVATSLAAILLSANLSGCQGGGAKKTNAVSNQPKEISISIFDRGEVPASEGDYSKNRWTKWIEEQSGIKVKWVPVPRNEAQQKLNMLIAAGEAPDLIVEYDPAFISSLVNQGIAKPIDEYVEKYSKTYKKYLQDNPELKSYVTFNGKMYAFTSKRSIEAFYNHGIWIRQDWLDKLNLKMPTTDEELIEVAKAFTYNDPDGNGKNDTLGLAVMQWQEITQALYQASSLWYVEDGKLVYGPLTDRFADSVRFFKRLYQEQVIDKEFITDRQSTNQKQLWATGKAGMLTNNWQERLNKELMENVPGANPVPLEPVSTKYGKNGLWQETLANKYVVFNEKMKNPEAGVEFLDWMIDKGWFTLMFGEEGVHHTMVDGVPQMLDAKKNDVELKYLTDYPILAQWSLKPEWIPQMAAKDSLSQALAQQKKASLETAMKNKFRRDLPYAPPIPDFTRINAEFNPKKDDIRIKVVVSGPEVTPEWGIQQLRAEWERLGGKEVDRLVNEWYQKNKDSLK